MTKAVSLTGKEISFGEDEIIVSKTDLKGRITYANDVFLRVSGYRESEVLGQPHSLIRHPDMPRCVFKLLWDDITAGSEVFAYVVNRCKNGDHYWVLAHVTPSRGEDGQIIGYHSNRRVPDRETLERAIVPLYRDLKAKEDSFDNRKEGMNAAFGDITALLHSKGVAYDEFIATL
ncbi:MAG: chemotaxis protein [Rhodospirillaceae bacterium]|nr:chemotaxis protein [Magnetovibrio sp.]MAY66820.1 chemotaxis protein [Rhodospirillaceae bacterium]|tara:strand:- start:600 stop:1124 length:525 start_codon:yes stop_codon:yes gene_type:complete